MSLSPFQISPSGTQALLTKFKRFAEKSIPELYSENDQPLFLFRDASFGTCTYNLTLLDCLHGVNKVRCVPGQCPYYFHIRGNPAAFWTQDSGIHSEMIPSVLATPSEVSSSGFGSVLLSFVLMTQRRICIGGQVIR